MAKKLEINKTQAVREYVKTHRDASRHEIAAALKKQGIEISTGHVATIKSAMKRHRAKKAAAASAAAATPGAESAAWTEKPVKVSDTLTLEHVKTVAQTVKNMGGFDRLKELLEVIREVGGLRRFRELLDAMAVTTPGNP